MWINILCSMERIYMIEIRKEENTGLLYHHQGLYSVCTVGTLRNHNGNANENIAWKSIGRARHLQCKYYLYFMVIPIPSICAMWPNNLVTEQVGDGIQAETENEKITLMFSTKPWIWSFYIVVWSKNKGLALARPLFFSLNLLFDGVLVAVAVVTS